jgi:hypothetical protein
MRFAPGTKGFPLSGFVRCAQDQLYERAQSGSRPWCSRRFGLRTLRGRERAQIIT